MKIAGSRHVSALIKGENHRAEGPVVHQAKGSARAAWIPILGLAVILLTIVGCSYGPDKLRTGAKGSKTRTQQKIADDMIAAMVELDKVIRDINNVASAKEAAPKVTELYGRMKSLLMEGQAAKLNSPGGLDQQAEAQLTARLMQVQASVTQGIEEMRKKVPVVPAELAKAFQDGAKTMLQAKADADKLQPSEILPDGQPDSSSWIVWLLCTIILAVCVGFLFRDGVWSNAIRLVNVVFAGLLAMNFYEPAAKYLTNVSEELHTYVAFFDFLALWACFVLFMAVLSAATDAVSRVRVRFLKVADQAGGIVLSLCIGWVMIGITLTSLHTAPVGQYPLMESFQPQNSMFFGMLAPDREWLAFTKYQSSNGFCRAVGQDCSFPSDFIETQLLRRMHIERYVLGNNEHQIRVNPQFMKSTAKPAGPAGGS